MREREEDMEGTERHGWGGRHVEEGKHEWERDTQMVREDKEGKGR